MRMGMIIMPLCQKHQIAKHSETVKLCMHAYGVAHAHLCMCVCACLCVYMCVYIQNYAKLKVSSVNRKFL